MKKFINVIGFLFFFSALSLAPFNTSAHTLVGDSIGATLSLFPAGGLYSANENFTISIYVNTGGQNVVAVGANLFYDKTNFQAVSIDLSGSDFTNTFENVIDSTNGEIKITQAKPSPGVNSSQGLVAKINFKALNFIAPTNDNFIFDFTPGSTVDSNIVLDDGHGTDIISGVYNEKFSVDQTAISTNDTVGDVAAPVISNSSPSGSLPANTSQTTLSLNTDEPALCRYSTTANSTYASMPDVFSLAAATAHAAVLNGLVNGQNYTYYVKCSDLSGNINATDYLINFSAANPIISSGGGGGGGGGVYIPPTVVASTSPIKSADASSATTTETTDENQEIKILGSSYEEEIVYNFFGLTKEAIEEISLNEAEMVFNYNHFVPLDQISIQLYQKVMPTNHNLTEQAKFAVANYLHNGTNSTKRLGAGERAGTLSSYQAAFSKMPQSLADWQDVIKIANGRWPAQISAAAESRAQTAFEKIYGRAADQNNNKDINAVKIAAYGLRPIYRNASSEKNAIETFKLSNGQMPANPIGWDLIRAMAYSGAKK